MKLLVHSPYMWWPAVLVSVSYYRALHVPEERRKGQITRFQFFLIVTVSSFAYSIVPSYLFPSITALSFICWIWKDSITAQQIGSGLQGLGLGSFGLSWTTVSSFLDSPMAVPTSVIIITMVGFIVCIYVLTPISYWTNAHNAKSFPIVSSGLFDARGQEYNVSRIMDKKFKFDEDAYNNYSKLYLSSLFQYAYGFGFASLTSSVSHAVLFYGRSIWNQSRSAYKAKEEDIHTQLMKKNYDSVPQWWFYLNLFTMICLAIFTCQVFKQQLQLSYWGVLLSAFVVFIFILPNGILAATANAGLSVGTVLDMMIAYIDPGKPIGNLTFTTCGHMSMIAVMGFTSDLKLGHYLKIPPKSMFLSQVFDETVHISRSLSPSLILADVEAIFQLFNLAKAETLVRPQKLCEQKGADVTGGVGPFGLLTLACAKREEQTAVFFRLFESPTKYVALRCHDPSRSDPSARV